MADSSAPASTGSPDTSVQDLRSIANDMPMDAFGFGGDDQGDEQGGEPGQGDAARSDAQGQESAPREEGQPRDEGGRFASRQPQPDESGEADAQGRREPEGAAQAQPGENKGAQEGAQPEADKPAEPKRLDFMEFDGRRYTTEDIQRGFMRTEDYSRKTGELSRERQALQSQVEQVRGYEQQLSEVLETAVSALRETLPPQPDPALLDTDPVAYHKQAIAHTNAVQRLQGLAGQREHMSRSEQQRRQQATEQQTAAQQQAMQEHQRQQVEALFEKMPALRTGEGERAFFEKATNYAGQYGLTGKELFEATLNDHRIALVLQDAILGHEVRTKRPQTTERLRAAPPIRPQARPEAGTRNGQARREANEQFAKNPTMKNALATGVLDDVFAGIS